MPRGNLSLMSVSACVLLLNWLVIFFILRDLTDVVSLGVL